MNQAEKMQEDIKTYVDQRDTLTEQKIKLWLFSSVFSQVVLLLPVIFFLGGLYQSAGKAIDAVASQAQVNQSVTERLYGLETRQMETRAWARTKGFVPALPDPKDTHIGQ